MIGVSGSGADPQTTTPQGCSCSEHCRATSDDGFFVSVTSNIY